MKNLKKEFIALLLYTVIISVLILISKYIKLDVTKLISTTALYLSLSSLIDKEYRE